MKTRWELCLVAFVVYASTLKANDFYVTPEGSPSGNGSPEQPWDLQTALSQPSAVQAGDTIWLRGGIYPKDGNWTVFRSSLSGSREAPIRVRQYPGERATIEGSLFQYSGQCVHYEDFELRNSYTNHQTSEVGSFPLAFQAVENGQTNGMAVAGADIRVPGIKLIDLVIHDHIGGGIGISVEAKDSELSGCLVYYNGWQGGDRAHGHGAYVQSADPGTATIKDCIFYGNYALGLQCTGAGSSTADNVRAEGNSIFFNGILASVHQQNMLIGPFTGAAKDPVVLNNCVYDTEGSSSDVYLGYTGALLDPVIIGNYFGTATKFAAYEGTMVLSNNTFLGGTLQLNTTSFPGNDYSTLRPETNFVRVCPDPYEPGRATITVFNWQGLSAAPLDLTSVLAPGTAFEIRNAQDFYGAPVTNGLFDGDPVLLPMNGLTVAAPAGAPAPVSTAPTFGVFIVQPTGIDTPPVISTITNQVLRKSTVSSPIPFTVGDSDTPLDALTLTVSSSNPALLPETGIILGGAGNYRTVTLAPVPGQVGRASVLVTVSDGRTSVFSRFQVTVEPPPELTLGLLAYYSFDESNGMAFQDGSGNGNAGTLVTAYYYAPHPSHIPGKMGAGALYLNGPDSFGYGLGDYVTLASAKALDIGSGDFTLAAWIQSSASNDMVILNKYGVGGKESGYLLALDGKSNGGKLRLRINDSYSNGGSLGAKTFFDTQALNDGQWHHVAAVVDRTNSETTFYVDGARSSISQGDNSGNLSAPTAFGIGKSTGIYGQWFLGAVDEVRVYGRALWSGEVQLLAGIPQPVPNLTVMRAGDSLTLTWPGAPDIRLQWSASLDAPAWEGVPESMGASIFTFPCTNASMFFRLTRP